MNVFTNDYLASLDYLLDLSRIIEDVNEFQEHKIQKLIINDSETFGALVIDDIRPISNQHEDEAIEYDHQIKLRFFEVNSQ